MRPRTIALAALAGAIAGWGVHTAVELLAGGHVGWSAITGTGLKTDEWMHRAVLTALGAALGATFAAVLQLRRAELLAVRLSEQRHRTLVSRLPDGVVYLVDRNMALVLAEGGALDYLDHPRGLVRRRLRDLLPPDLFGHVEPHYRAALEGEERAFEAEFQGRLFRIQVLPIRNDDGEIEAAMGVGRDITAERQMTDALRRAEQEWQHIFQAVGHPALIIDTEHRVLAVNAALGRTLAAAPESLVGRSCVDVLCTDVARAATGGPLRQLLARGAVTATTFELAILGGDYLLSCTPVHDAGGALTRLILVATDITPRKQAMQLLLERTREVESLADNVPDLIVRFDRAECIQYVNERAATVIGQPREALVGRTLSDAGLPRTVHADWQAGLSAAVTGGEPHDFTCELHAAGAARRYLARVVPEPGDDGRPAGALAVLTDVTELQTLQDELHHAQKMEVVGQLAAGVAHDLNNVLTAIAGFTSLARIELPDEHVAAGLLDRVDEATQQAAGVTRALLTFSHKAPADTTVLRLQDVVARAARLLGRMLPAGIEFRQYDAAPEPLWVRGDAVQLQQVLLNLALNARDAMPGGGRLELRLGAVAAERPDGPPDALLEVRDTGTGIPPEHRDRLYEPFFTTKGAGHGTGLGLPIVKGIVEAHGGRVDFETAVGAGTCFRVRLPTLSPAEARAAEARANGGTPFARGELVLVVEDNRQVLDVLTSGLRQAGFAVATAAGVGAARAEYGRQRERLRLLITDVDLPDGSGLELLHELRRAGSEVPAVVMTGVVDRDIERELDGRARLLRKPMRMAELLSVAGELLHAGAEVRTQP